MDWIVRMVVVLCVAGCGPRVVVPGEDEGGEGGEAPSPAPDTTGGSVPPSVTIGTAPMPVTTTDPYDPTTGGPFYPDWGLPGATAGDCHEWPAYECAQLPRPNATVVGDTPLGTFDTQFAVFASEQFCDQCVETPNLDRVLLVADPGDLPDEPDERIELALFAYEGPDNAIVEVEVNAIRDGMAASEWGTAQIYDLPAVEDLADPFDPANAFVITGSFGVDAPGWTLSGNFVAAYCPALNSYAICE